jgi:enamine deaminase RidA (YjgF/YER057c/UK114 family)
LSKVQDRRKEVVVIRQKVSARTPWEEVFGYSRAVRIGNVVKVGGTAATDEHGSIHGKGNIYAQTIYVIKKIEQALVETGATLKDVVRTRVFVTDINAWEGVAKGHAEYFGDIRPATTLVEVSRLITPELLVEIEAEAIIDGEGASA